MDDDWSVDDTWTHEDDWPEEEAERRKKKGCGLTAVFLLILFIPLLRFW